MFSKANVDKEITEIVIELKVRGVFFGGPSIDGASAGVDAVPAAEGAGTFGLEVKGGAERDYALDLGGYL